MCYISHTRGWHPLTSNPWISSPLFNLRKDERDFCLTPPTTHAHHRSLHQHSLPMVFFRLHGAGTDVPLHSVYRPMPCCSNTTTNLLTLPVTSDGGSLVPQLAATSTAAMIAPIQLSSILENRSPKWMLLFVPMYSIRSTLTASVVYSVDRSRRRRCRMIGLRSSTVITVGSGAFFLFRRTIGNTRECAA